MKRFVQVFLLLNFIILITSCPHYLESRVKVTNLNSNTALSVYVGGINVGRLSGNSASNYFYINAGDYRVKASYDNSSDTDSNADITIEWGPLYNILIDSGYVNLATVNTIDPEQFEW
jgi:hypothetical protein